MKSFSFLEFVSLANAVRDVAYRKFPRRPSLEVFNWPRHNALSVRQLAINAVSRHAMKANHPGDLEYPTPDRQTTPPCALPCPVVLAVAQS
jgi:hypothetical protein